MSEQSEDRPETKLAAAINRQWPNLEAHQSAFTARGPGLLTLEMNALNQEGRELLEQALKAAGATEVTITEYQGKTIIRIQEDISKPAGLNMEAFANALKEGLKAQQARGAGKPSPADESVKPRPEIVIGGEPVKPGAEVVISGERVTTSPAHAEEKEKLTVLEHATDIPFHQRKDGSYESVQPLTKQQMQGLLALGHSKDPFDQAAYQALVGSDGPVFEKAVQEGQPIRLQFTPQEVSEASAVLTNPDSRKAMQNALGTKDPNPEVVLGGERITLSPAPQQPAAPAPRPAQRHEPAPGPEVKTNLALLEEATGLHFIQREDGSYQSAEPLTRKQQEGLQALGSSKDPFDRAVYDALVGNDKEAFEQALKSGNKIRLQFTPKELSEAAGTLTTPRCREAIHQAFGATDPKPQPQTRIDGKPGAEVVISGDPVKLGPEVLISGEPVKLGPEVVISGEPVKPGAEVVIGGEPVKLRPQVVISGEPVKPGPEVVISGEAVKGSDGDVAREANAKGAKSAEDAKVKEGVAGGEASPGQDQSPGKNTATLEAVFTLIGGLLGIAPEQIQGLLHPGHGGPHQGQETGKDQGTDGPAPSGNSKPADGLTDDEREHARKALENYGEDPSKWTFRKDDKGQVVAVNGNAHDAHTQLTISVDSGQAHSSANNKGYYVSDKKRFGVTESGQLCNDAVNYICEPPWKEDSLAKILFGKTTDSADQGAEGKRPAQPEPEPKMITKRPAADAGPEKNGAATEGDGYAVHQIDKAVEGTESGPRREIDTSKLPAFLAAAPEQSAQEVSPANGGERQTATSRPLPSLEQGGTSTGMTTGGAEGSTAKNVAAQANGLESPRSSHTALPVLQVQHAGYNGATVGGQSVGVSETGPGKGVGV